jgi:hypothetical protein
MRGEDRGAPRKQLPSGSAKSYFRWAGGVNGEITSASLAQVQFEDPAVLHLVRGSRIGSLLASDAPHSGTLWYWSVGELMSLGIVI